MISELSCGALRTGVTPLDFCKTVAKLENALPQYDVWDSIINNPDRYIPFLVNKLLEVFYSRCCTELSRLFNEPVNFGSLKYETALSHEADFLLNGYDLFEEGYDLTYFVCEGIHGLCEQEELKLCPTFEIESFEEWNCSGTLEPEELGEDGTSFKLLEYYIGDYFKDDKELYGVPAIGQFAELANYAMMYAENGQRFYFFRNKYVGAFFEWQSIHSVKDELVTICQEALKRIHSSSCHVDCLSLQTSVVETKTALYIMYMYGSNDWGEEYDIRFRRPHFIFDAMIVDMALQALNKKYGFYKEEKSHELQCN